MAIYVHASVGSFSDVAAFAVYVNVAPALCNGVVVDHAVDHTARNKESHFRRAEFPIIVVVLRLRKYRNGHSETL